MTGVATQFPEHGHGAAQVPKHGHGAADVPEHGHGAAGPPTAGDTAGEISAALFRLFRFGGRMKAELAAARPAGHDLPTLACLHRLAEDGPLRATALAERMHMDPAQVSRAVSTLVRERAVIRQADPDDGRATLLVVTDAGHNAAAEFGRARADYIHAVVDTWPAPDAEAFLVGLTRFVDDLERLLPARDGRSRDDPGPVQPTHPQQGGDEAAPTPAPSSPGGAT